MYVCLRRLSMYVCMYVCLRQLSVYVCLSQAAERVCMYVSNSGVEICSRVSIESTKNRLILIWSKNVSALVEISRSALTKIAAQIFRKFCAQQLLVA